MMPVVSHEQTDTIFQKARERSSNESDSSSESN